MIWQRFYRLRGLNNSGIGSSTSECFGVTAHPCFTAMERLSLSIFLQAGISVIPFQAGLVHSSHSVLRPRKDMHKILFYGIKLVCLHSCVVPGFWSLWCFGLGNRVWGLAIEDLCFLGVLGSLDGVKTKLGIKPIGFLGDCSWLTENQWNLFPGDITHNNFKFS